MSDGILKLLLNWRWWVMVILLSPLLAVSAIVVLLVYLTDGISSVVGYVERLVYKAYDSKLVDVLYRFTFDSKRK